MSRTSTPNTALLKHAKLGPLAVVLALALVMTACSEQEPEVTRNEQVPAAQAQQESTEGGEDGDAGGGGAADFAAAEGVWTAEQLAYTSAPSSIASGGVVIGLEIIGGLPHNVIFEGFEGDRILVEGSGEGTYAATVDVPPGTYTYYCGISGHRAAGMEGTIEVA